MSSELLLLAGAGMVAGWINTLAGGGSVIALPALIWGAGLAADDANGTLRLAILAQNIVAVSRYRQRGVLTLGEVPWLPALVGALGGAGLAVSLDAGAVKGLLSAALGLVAVTMLYNPIRVSSDSVELPRWIAPTALLCAGFYGGLVQAGVGFALLLALTRGYGQELAQANVTKVALVLAYTLPATLVFALSGHVRLEPGLALGVGCGLGAWLAASVAMSDRGRRWTRITLAVAACLCVLKLLWSRGL